jgi:CheY-like chemotaxis protein
MRRVLVVDDEENIRLVLKTLLKRHGYDVEVADSGESALALVDSFGPDVILTDVRMPKMNGLDLLATLKAKQNPATVIVMSTYVPVLACLGCDEQGVVYNINADAVANQVAIRLDARALVLVTDVPGVLRDINDPASRIGRMTFAEGKKAIADGVVTKGMVPKLEESFASIEKGVRAVYIMGRLERGDLARAVREPGSVGTVLVA